MAMVLGFDRRGIVGFCSRCRVTAGGGGRDRTCEVGRDASFALAVARRRHAIRIERSIGLAGKNVVAAHGPRVATIAQARDVGKHRLASGGFEPREGREVFARVYAQELHVIECRARIRRRGFAAGASEQSKFMFELFAFLFSCGAALRLQSLPPDQRALHASGELVRREQACAIRVL
jgi:hypothetical protein